MFKIHIRKTFGNLNGWIHVTERSCENEFVAIGGELANCSFGILTFWNKFNKCSFDFASECFVDGEATFVMLIGPAMVSDRPDIHKSYLKRIFCQRTS